MALSLPQWDELEYMRAELDGQPLPEVKAGPALQALIGRIEAHFGLTVLVRPHTFGRAGVVGSVRSDEGVMTLLLHPNWPEEKARRTAYHEAGHLTAQAGEGAQFDRATIPGYFACEREANAYSYDLAEAWGDAGLFDDDTKADAARQLDEEEEACWALASVAGTDDAFVVNSLLTILCYGADRFLGLGPMAPAQVAEMAWSSPEELVGFDRTALRGAWRVTTMGPPAEPLGLVDEETAQGQLAYAMGEAQPWRYDPDARRRWGAPRLSQPPGDCPRIVLWLEADSVDLSGFVGLAQTILLAEPTGQCLGAEWHIYRGEMSIYNLRACWPDGPGRPGWDIFYVFGPSRHQRAKRQEDALRLFVNGWRSCCGIHHWARLDWVFQYVDWLWQHTIGPTTEDVIEAALNG
jgi:hypothetical protein